MIRDATFENSVEEVEDGIGDTANGGRCAAGEEVTRRLLQAVPVSGQHHREGGSDAGEHLTIWLGAIVLDEHHEGEDLCVHDHLKAKVGHVELVCEDAGASNDCAIVEHAIVVVEGPIRTACWPRQVLHRRLARWSMQ